MTVDGAFLRNRLLDILNEANQVPLTTTEVYDKLDDSTITRSEIFFVLETMSQERRCIKDKSVLPCRWLALPLSSGEELPPFGELLQGGQS
jgi:hypothetical protein